MPHPPEYGRTCYISTSAATSSWLRKDMLHFPSCCSILLIMEGHVTFPLQLPHPPDYWRTSYISPPATTSTWLWKDMLHFNFCCHFLPLKTPWDRIWLWSSSYLFSSSWIWSVSEALSKNIFNWIINQNTNHHKHFYGLIRFCRGEMIFLFNIQWIVSSGFSAGIIILSSFDTLYWQ